MKTTIALLHHEIFMLQVSTSHIQISTNVTLSVSPQTLIPANITPQYYNYFSVECRPSYNTTGNIYNKHRH